MSFRMEVTDGSSFRALASLMVVGLFGFFAVFDFVGCEWAAFPSTVYQCSLIW